MSRERRLQEQAAQAEQDRLITNQAASAERSAIGQIRNRVAMRDAWLTATFSGARNGRTPLAVAGGTRPINSSIGGSSGGGGGGGGSTPPAGNANQPPPTPQDFLKRLFANRRQPGSFDWRGMVAQQFGNWIRR